MMHLVWNRFDYQTLDEALSQSFCLYVFHHPVDGDRPFYIGKAKLFGTKQKSGYAGTARYNSGYVHLIAGMLRSGFSLYIAEVGADHFDDVEGYEQELIAQWNPIRPQRIKVVRKPVASVRPWEVTTKECLEK
ncbi:hypothetical protein [Paraburkholderia nodosa]|uniref:hypothetical protein n=1 Tax=Paraburkholderia nodosa TaxID=392320 RepID=UPI00114CDAE7|nr:hypothetical protein [Paraburkholderia nodosa]